MHFKRAAILSGALLQHITGINAAPAAFPQEQSAAAKALAADQCGSQDRVLSKDTWAKFETDKWFKNWWNTEGKATGKPLMKAFEEKWLTKVGQLNCDVSKPCQAPSCDSVTDPNTGERVIQAYFITHALVNFNNWLAVSYDKISLAQIYGNSVSTTMVNTFSTARNPPPNKKDPFQLFMSLIGAITSGFGLIPGLGTPAALVGTAITFINLGVPKPGSAPTVVPTQLDKVGDLGRYLADFCDKSRNAIIEVQKQAFTGNPDNAGTDIFKYIEGGSMFLWTDNGAELTTYYQKQIRARCLNQLMLGDSTFIVKAPASGGNCDSDQGLNENMKFCDPNDMVNAYHIYQWDLNYNDEFPPLRVPRGWDQLSSVLGFTIKDVLASSVASFNAGGNIYGLTIGSQTQIAPRDKPAEVSSPGVFSIPVCVSMDGTARSKYDVNNIHDGLLYPCTCGSDQRWNKGDRSFTIGDEEQKWMPDKPETRAFWHFAHLDWQDWSTINRDSREQIMKYCTDRDDSFFSFTSFYQDNWFQAWPGGYGNPDIGKSRPQSSVPQPW